MPTIRIPLYGSYTNRNLTPQTVSSVGQQFINCYPEVVVNSLTQKTEVELYKRPGFSFANGLSNVSSTISTGAIISWTGSSSNAIPPVVASLQHTSGTSTGTFDLIFGTQIGGFIPATNDCSALTETVLNGNAQLFGYFHDAVSGEPEAWYFPEGGSWTQVTSACITSATISTRPMGAPVHLDGYTFLMMQDGTIRNTDLNTVSSIPALNFIAAGSYPDRGVSLARMGEYIMAFGETSIEPFVNAGNATGSPLSRVTNGTITMGAARRLNNSITGINPQTVLAAFGTVYWIGTNSDGAVIGVFRFKGLAPEKISTPAIEKALSRSSGFYFLGTKVFQGMRHITLIDASTPSIGVMNYCIDTNFWWIEQLTAGTTKNTLGVREISRGVTYFTTSLNARGHVYGAVEAYQDATSTYSLSVQTDNMDLGTDRKKYWKKFRIAYDRQASASPITVSASDNDFSSYSALGSIDTVSTNAQSWLNRLGASRRRSWKLNHSSNTACRIRAIEIDYDVGTS